MEKICEKIFSPENKKGWRKIPLGFSLLANTVEKKQKFRKLQKAEKGRKIWYSMGKIRGRFSSRRIKKVAKNSPGHFSFK
jgi:hypothetical protein